eukprot:TRINITY_DN31112_c0_g1_i1.p1 TRINITY_DN31112_c0_g1~~TRINITY_DN31112_c0_g1_i1.p1  ORF type:complete len:437 (+),score=61.53 TRINITY_DN31112_c0_g1_i1:43-1353(+)
MDAGKRRQDDDCEKEQIKRSKNEKPKTAADCVSDVCRKELSMSSIATAAVMYEAFLELDKLLRSRLQPFKVKKAYKVLEQVWISAMQGDSAARLESPFIGIVLQDTNQLKQEWNEKVNTLQWNQVINHYTAYNVNLKNKREEMVKKLTENYEPQIVNLTGDDILKQPCLAWPEVQDTFDVRKQKTIVDSFKGKTLQLVAGTDQTVLLTRPLTSKRLVELCDSPEGRIQLAVHTLVYNSMFVTGQAMGLSQRFHDAVMCEPWINKDAVILEMYSHLVNQRCSPHPNLTMIPVADGSIGRVQDFDLQKFAQLKDGVLFCNPPYVEVVMNRDLPKVVEALSTASKEGNTLTIVSLLPDWPDNDGVAAFINSTWLRSHWVLPKSEHLVCLENGTEIPMHVSQRLSLLSTESDIEFTPSLFQLLAREPEKFPTVPDSVKVK